MLAIDSPIQAINFPKAIKHYQKMQNESRENKAPDPQTQTRFFQITQQVPSLDEAAPRRQAMATNSHRQAKISAHCSLFMAFYPKNLYFVIMFWLFL